MELIQSRNYVHFMKAEYFRLFVKEIATGPYPAPDEFNEHTITPSFYIVHFNITPCHSGSSRCVTLYSIKQSIAVKQNKYLMLVIQCYLFRFNESSSSGITLLTFKKHKYTCNMHYWLVRSHQFANIQLKI